MIVMDATVDASTANAFASAFELMKRNLGKMSAEAPRRASIQICKSFRANTKTAKKIRPVSVVKLSSGETDMPLWVTWDNKTGQPLNPAKRLFRVWFPERMWGFNKHYYLTEGKRAEEVARKKKEELERLYTFEQRKTGTRGLAKRSWGWVMHNIFSGAAPDTPWYKRKNDKRNPKDTTNESYSRVEQDGGIAHISNKLDYARDALTISVDAVVEKATSAIVKVIATKHIRADNRGMSSKEIRAAAEKAKDDFMRQFRY